MKTRVIPVLLIRDELLYKSIQFKNYIYIGDPINTVRIFNEKEVDEIIILDITASLTGKKPNFKLIKDIASEAFMPVAYGGGVRELNDIKKILRSGIEKVVINTHAVKNPLFIREASKKFGSQAIIASIDAKKIGNNYFVFTHDGKKKTPLNPFEHAKRMEEMGAGEIMITSIDKDGTMSGYDLELIKGVSNIVNIPVIASGGAGKIGDFVKAVKSGASAVAAGSMFVFYGRKRGVLITYPERKLLERVLP